MKRLYDRLAAVLGRLPPDRLRALEEHLADEERREADMEEIQLNEEEEAALDASWKKQCENLTEEEKRRSRMVPDPDDSGSNEPENDKRSSEP